LRTGPVAACCSKGSYRLNSGAIRLSVKDCFPPDPALQPHSLPPSDHSANSSYSSAGVNHLSGLPARRSGKRLHEEFTSLRDCAARRFRYGLS
jgi:hypothetical protein